jgi:hypothetical protein
MLPLPDPLSPPALLAGGFSMETGMPQTSPARLVAIIVLLTMFLAVFAGWLISGTG